jgi:flap endonuclease-1
MDPLIVVSGTDVRERLELSQSQFIDFALLLGTDFSQRIKNIGPARALKFIREYGSIERIVEHERQYTPREPMAAYLQEVALARMIFRTLPPIPEGELTSVDADHDAVHEIMQRYDLSEGLSNEHLWPDNALPGENYFQDRPFGS